MTCVSSRRCLATLAGVALACALSAQYPAAVDAPSHLRDGLSAIRTSDARTWLNYLAGPECMGRGTGQPGYQKAADYVAARFREFGLKPIGENGTYFQNLTFQKVTLDAAKSNITIEPTDRALMPSSGFAIDGLAADVNLKGSVMFVRAGTKEAQAPDASVFRDKIVVLTAVDGAAITNQIARSGAAALLTVVPGTSVESSERTLRPGGSRPGRAPRTVRGRLTHAFATQLASLTGVDAGLVRASGETPFQAVDSARTASMTLALETTEVKVPNVVAALEGSDPALKHEVVGIGSHLDHMGVQNGVVFWGADDDASGSTALLLVAKAFSQNPVKPKRTIVFMAFAAEEMGLLGAGHYATNPIYPLKDQVAHLQMDMVGRNEQTNTERAEDNIDTIHLVGSQRHSTQLHELCLEMNKYVGFKFEYDEEDVYTRSDHYQFASRGVPVAFVFSGFHPDYHQPTDTADKINFDKIANAAKLFYMVAHEAGTRPRLVIDKSGG